MPEPPNRAMARAMLTTFTVVLAVGLTVWADYAVCAAIGPGDGPGVFFAWIFKAVLVVPISLVGIGLALATLSVGGYVSITAAQRERRRSITQALQEIDRAEREGRS